MMDIETLKDQALILLVAWSLGKYIGEIHVTQSVKHLHSGCARVLSHCATCFPANGVYHYLFLNRVEIY